MAQCGSLVFNSWVLLDLVALSVPQGSGPPTPPPNLAAFYQVERINLISIYCGVLVMTLIEDLNQRGNFVVCTLQP